MSDKAYYQKNKERVLATSRAWKVANPERTKEIQRRWREKNKDKIREREPRQPIAEICQNRESIAAVRTKRPDERYIKPRAS